MSVLEKFERVASGAPDSVAIHDLAGDTTYAALAERANHISQFLTERGVGPGDRVIVGHVPGSALISAMIGIMQIGAAYIPVDLAAPDARNLLIAKEAGPGYALLPDTALAEISDICAKCAIDDIPVTASATQPAIAVDAATVAYIIFTSGTTGVPKGVQITHGNLAALFDATQGMFEFGPHDRSVLYHSYAFDFSVWEIWSMLCYGGCLFVPEQNDKIGVNFARYLRDHEISVLNQTPSAFAVNSPEMIKNGPEAYKLRTVIFGGERLNPPLLAPWAKVFPLADVALINMYGITETTIHTTFYRICEDDLGRLVSPIGDVLDGFETRVVVHEDGGDPAIGELLLAGPQVAVGYLDRPEITEERFFVEDGVRFYQTGDLVERLETGGFLYRGRVDDQLAINGHRVETGEIEAALFSDSHVLDLTIIVEDSDFGPLLVCFYVAEIDGMQRRLRSAANKNLPVYMRPNKYVSASHINRTANGKVDKAALGKQLAARSKK